MCISSNLVNSLRALEVTKLQTAALDFNAEQPLVAIE